MYNIEILIDDPHLICTKDLKQLSPIHWCKLLRNHPKFADRCNCWDEFSGFGWTIILLKQPQFIDKCDWTKLTTNQWNYLYKTTHNEAIKTFVEEYREHYLLMNEIEVK